jgi:GNAT superfamily N-acetyltransferase
MGTVEVTRVGLASADAQRLIARLNAELLAMYPEEGATFFSLSEDDVAPGTGAFFVAYLDGVAMACGAVRRLDAVQGEIKRMYTDPEARGQRLAARIVEAIEVEARRIGLGQLVLETGVRQLAAHALYERLGFGRIECWGKYLESPLSICMGKPVD